MKNKNRIKKLKLDTALLRQEVAPLYMRVEAVNTASHKAIEMIKRDRASAILVEDVYTQEMEALRQDIAYIKEKLESSGVVDNWSFT